METKTIKDIQIAADLLAGGEVVAFPTETVYGLGGLATSDAAILKIFEAKGRPSDNPLIVHIASKDQLSQVVSQVPENAQKLMDTFWPGPLTIVLPKVFVISSLTTASLETVGVRIPSHPVALALLKEVNAPIAAPSANVSGRPSPTRAEHVMTDLCGKIPAVLDGGACDVGLESTVIDCTGETPVILRPGGVSKEEIEALIGRVMLSNPDVNDSPKSPGMKYKHYAPKAPFYVVKGGADALHAAISKAKTGHKTVGALLPKELLGQYLADVKISCGSLHNEKSFAQEFYHSLRKFDENEVDIILFLLLSDMEYDAAFLNRLYKASGGNVWE